ncbi:hypothetical protein N41_1006 [Lactococcus cremoris]|uniref:hypothetical protein n=1 Tax=Lactococcus lactis subsp. cremoris TaxID=1359 RepID=UPI0007AE48AA|nr:hypothetical protein [Lactococcus cremoris]KZK39638.1 hypothetical protein N41_1006 [Lactococcus cremoris]
MENQENRVELDELIKGLGIISNVMLLGRLLPTETSDFKDVSDEQMLTNYNNLCEMTEVYTDHLISGLSEVEKNWRTDNVDASKFRKIDAVIKAG